MQLNRAVYKTENIEEKTKDRMKAGKFLVSLL